MRMVEELKVVVAVCETERLADGMAKAGIAATVMPEDLPTLRLCRRSLREGTLPILVVESEDGHKRALTAHLALGVPVLTAHRPRHGFYVRSWDMFYIPPRLSSIPFMIERAIADLLDKISPEHLSDILNQLGRDLESANASDILELLKALSA